MSLFTSQMNLPVVHLLQQHTKQVFFVGNDSLLQANNPKLFTSENLNYKGCELAFVWKICLLIGEL